MSYSLWALGHLKRCIDSCWSFLWRAIFVHFSTLRGSLYSSKKESFTKDSGRILGHSWGLIFAPGKLYLLAVWEGKRKLEIKLLSVNWQENRKILGKSILGYLSRRHNIHDIQKPFSDAGGLLKNCVVLAKFSSLGLSFFCKTKALNGFFTSAVLKALSLPVVILYVATRGTKESSFVETVAAHYGFGIISLKNNQQGKPIFLNEALNILKCLFINWYYSVIWTGTSL